MMLEPIEKDPDVKRAIEIDIGTYRGTATVNGTPTWSVPSGLTVVDDSFADDIAIGIISGGQEGCRYLVTCHVDFVSGPSEDFTIDMRVRTGAGDPRLQR
jgi:hypothetical protein